ncbi:hypothetical protein NCZ33_19230, partial [Bacteroides ovatus]|uniref:hypothetical protein n=1 Tax=Bacteroides ovatus TaxID=28116 RepID=UPI00202F6CA9
EHIFMCYIYKDNQKSAYIQNIYWVYADYIRQLSYERTFSVPSILGWVFFFCPLADRVDRSRALPINGID